MKTRSDPGGSIGSQRRSHGTYYNGRMTKIATAPSLADMLRGFSIEVNPGEMKVIDAAPGRLDPGTEVFMTWIPGKNPMDTIGPAKKLRDAGLYPTPHIGARHVASASRLAEFIGRLVRE